jgi:DNA-binding transcriptional LysR family regulator
VAVVQEGSFSAAARRLQMSPQLVSKYVGQLEDRLGARLLQRSTRRLSTTEAGLAYSERCRQVLADIDEMEDAVGETTAQARGTLRINAPMSFGISHLSRAVALFQVEQPSVSVHLTLNDRVVDIVSEGFDLAIRIARLAESTLVARRIAPVRLVACAAPAYLAARGVPATPADLENHNCLGYSYAADRGQWTFKRGSEEYSVAIKGSFSANNGDALREAALAGAGIVLQPSFIVGNEIRSGRLQVLLPEYSTAGLNLYAVYAHRQYLSAKVRTFIDFLSGYFDSPPYWDEPWK